MKALKKKIKLKIKGLIYFYFLLQKKNYDFFEKKNLFDEYLLLCYFLLFDNDFLLLLYLHLILNILHQLPH